MNIAAVIARVESAGNQYAQRFEKLHLGVTSQSTLKRIVATHHGRISSNTADVYASMSHGLYQIMGFELWGPVMLYPKTLWEFLTSPDEQNAALAKFLELDGFKKLTVDDLRMQGTRDHFAHLYNGPNNVAEYSARILKAITDLDALTIPRPGPLAP